MFIQAKTQVVKRMANSRVKLTFTSILLSCILSACSQIKETGRTVGHTTRDVATDIGHGSRDAAKAIGEGVKKAVRSVTADDK